jgi:hypothetical protein
MTTLYFKPKDGTEAREEMKNITPEAIDDDKFLYRDQFEALHEANQERVDQFKTDSKNNAVDILNIFKTTGRYIAIVQLKGDYFVYFDKKIFLRIGERLVREVNPKVAK